MSGRTIFSIVEGDGEVAALPVLLRLIEPDAQVLRPFRCPRQRLQRDDELRRVLENARLRTAATDLVLLLLDADDDPPCPAGPELLARAQAVVPDRQVRVVLACREFESWFLGALPSLAGRRLIPRDVGPIDAPEQIRGAKERLGQLMGRRYSPTVDQPAFAALFDRNMARHHCPSFDKLLRDLGH